MANWHTTNRRALRKLRQKHRTLPHLANYLLENFGLVQINKMDAIRAATDTVLENDGFGQQHDPNGGMGTMYRMDANTMPNFLQDVNSNLQGYSFDPNAVPIAGAIKDTLNALQVRLWHLAQP